MFSSFSRYMSQLLGNPIAFILAVSVVLIWVISGPYFGYSETWQLIINTGTTIVTFIMIFLLQNTQNHDTIAVHLKLDEIIRSLQNSHNELLKAEELSDEDLEKLLKRYEGYAKTIKRRMKKGDGDREEIDSEN